MLPARSVGNTKKKSRISGDITSFKAHKGKRMRDEYVCQYIACSLKHKMYNIHTYIKMFTNCSDEMENVFH